MSLTSGAGGHVFMLIEVAQSAVCNSAIGRGAFVAGNLDASSGVNVRRLVPLWVVQHVRRIARAVRAIRDGLRGGVGAVAHDVGDAAQRREPHRARRQFAPLLTELIFIHFSLDKTAIAGLTIAPAVPPTTQFRSRFDTSAADLCASFLLHWSFMAEIDDIFARLGGGRIASTDQSDRRDIPRRGKAGGSRVVEVVHLRTRRPGAGPAVTHRTESGVRAQTWDGGFPTKPSPLASTLTQPMASEAPEQVGHVITRWEPMAEAAPIPPAAPAPVEVPTRAIDALTARSALNGTKSQARSVADPFDPEDDRANCLRCGYALGAGRERRGLTICAACAA